jgi:inhibitor of cysteine peptidase
VEPYLFDQTNNGETYTVPLDGEVQLRLPENPSTGYSWNIALPSGLVIMNDSYVPNATSDQVVGSGGIHTWFLKAVLPGTQTIHGVYARPWESTPTGGEFQLTLLVQESCENDTCGPSAPPRYHVYTGEDHGKQVNEALGEEFNIRLEENPSTGYSWNFSISEGLQMVKDEFIASETGGMVVGAGGIRSIHLQTVKAGEQTVSGEYRRPWMTTGTVTYINLEGGFFGIVADDGKEYLPLNLETKYQVDTLRVAFDHEIVKDVATIQQWGTPVNLTSIEEIPGFELTVIVG